MSFVCVLLCAFWAQRNSEKHTSDNNNEKPKMRTRSMTDSHASFENSNHVKKTTKSTATKRKIIKEHDYWFTHLFSTAINTYNISLDISKSNFLVKFRYDLRDWIVEKYELEDKQLEWRDQSPVWRWRRQSWLELSVLSYWGFWIWFSSLPKSADTLSWLQEASQKTHLQAEWEVLHPWVQWCLHTIFRCLVSLFAMQSLWVDPNCWSYWFWTTRILEEEPRLPVSECVLRASQEERPTRVCWLHCRRKRPSEGSRGSTRRTWCQISCVQEHLESTNSTIHAMTKCLDRVLFRDKSLQNRLDFHESWFAMLSCPFLQSHSLPGKQKSWNLFLKELDLTTGYLSLQMFL